MILNTVFWLFVAIDAVVFGLVLVLGLAAAAPSRTPLPALWVLVVPPLLLFGAVYLHLRSPVALLRALAFAAVVLPGVALGAQGLWNGYVAFTNPDALWGETKLTRALRELPKDPSQLAVLRSLLAAGEDPDREGEALPLAMAVYAAKDVGDEPLRLLLDAGADPNQRDQFGEPAWFAATGGSGSVAVLQLLLERGADLQATSRDGRGAAWHAVDTENWPVAKLLLERGARIDGISPMGMPLRETLEGRMRARGDALGPAASAVLELVRARK